MVAWSSLSASQKAALSSRDTSGGTVVTKSTTSAQLASMGVSRATPTTTTSTDTFQGPVKPGTSEQTFRETGTSVQQITTPSPTPTTTSNKSTSPIPQLQSVPSQPPMTVAGSVPGSVTEVRTGTVIMPGQSTSTTAYVSGAGALDYDRTYQSLATEYAAKGLGDPRGMSNTQLAMALNRNINVSNVREYQTEKNIQASAAGQPIPYPNIPAQPTTTQVLSVLKPISYQEYAARGQAPEGYVWGYPETQTTQPTQDWSWAMSKTPEAQRNELFAAEGAGFIMPTGASKGSVLVNQFSLGFLGTPEYRTPTQEEIKSGLAVPATVVAGREAFIQKKQEQLTPFTRFSAKLTEKSEKLATKLFQNQPDVIVKTVGTGLVMLPARTSELVTTTAAFGSATLKYGPIRAWQMTPTTQLGDVTMTGAVVATEGIGRFVAPVTRQVLNKFGFAVKTETELAGMALKTRQAGKDVLFRIPETQMTEEITVTGLRGVTKTQKAVGVTGSVMGGLFLGGAVASAAYSEKPSESFSKLIATGGGLALIDIGASKTFTAAKEVIITPSAYGKPIVNFAMAEKELLKTTPKGEQAAGQLYLGTQIKMRNLLGQEYIAETIARGPTAQLAGRGAMEASAITSLKEVKTGKTLLEMPGRISSVFQISNVNEAFAESVGGQTPYEYYDVFGMSRTGQRMPSSKVEFAMRDLFSEISITKESKRASITTPKGIRELEWARGTAFGELSTGKTTKATKAQKGSLLTMQERWQDLSKQKRPESTSWLVGRFKSQTVRTEGKGARKSIWDLKVIDYPKESRTSKALNKLKALEPMPLGKKGQVSLVPQFGIERGTETGFEILSREEPKTITREEPKTITREASVAQRKALEEAQKGSLIQASKDLTLGVSKGRLKLLEELKSAPRIFIGLGSRGVTRAATKSISKTESLTEPLTRTVPLIGTETGLISRAATKATTRQVTRQVTDTTGPPTPPPPTVPVPFVFAFPGAEVGGRPPTAAEVRRTSRKMAYTPNVLGLLSGGTISAKEVKRGAYSGFEIRKPVRGTVGGMLWFGE